MIPNSRMGSVIGKGGTKIKEIQDASGARLNASEGMLPGSTEVRPTWTRQRLCPNICTPQRVLSVSGVADAIHIATYYIGNILIEANERMPSSNNSSYRPSSYSRRPPSYQGSSYVPGYSNPYAGGSHSAPQQLQTQQIYIPNDLVGCIIGKGGAKINEIRHMSASQIKIMEPGAVGVGMNGAPAPAGGEGERLVVITGQPANIQMAVQLLYHVRVIRIYAWVQTLTQYFFSDSSKRSKSSFGRSKRVPKLRRAPLQLKIITARPGSLLCSPSPSFLICLYYLQAPYTSACRSFESGQCMCPHLVLDYAFRVVLSSATALVFHPCSSPLLPCLTRLASAYVSSGGLLRPSPVNRYFSIAINAYVECM